MVKQDSGVSNLSARSHNVNTLGMREDMAQLNNDILSFNVLIDRAWHEIFNTEDRLNLLYLMLIGFACTTTVLNLLFFFESTDKENMKMTEHCVSYLAL